MIKFIFNKIKVFLIIISLVLLFGEFYLRLFYFAWPFEAKMLKLSHLSESDVNLRWRYTSGEGRNSLGLKGSEIKEKESGVIRILFLGDSLVWSGGTSSGELYTEKIEQELNENFGLGVKFEIINAGVPGYTTYQELEFLKVYGMDMDPDIVVLGFVMNDVYYKYLHVPTEASMLSIDPEVYLHRFDTSTTHGKIFTSSYLAHESINFLRKLKNTLTRRINFSFEDRIDFYLAWKDYGWSDTEFLINEMKSTLSRNDIPLLMVVFPVSDQVNEEYLEIDEAYVLYPQSRISEINDSLDISYLDMQPPLRENGGVDLYSDYLHLNSKGNDLVASEISAFLIENDLVVGLLKQ